MMTADHPNARWLAEQYRGRVALENDHELDAEARERAIAVHQQRMFARISPEWIIHTAGKRLQATGGVPFAGVMARRRAALAPVFWHEVDHAVADDNFGIVYLSFRMERGDRSFTGDSFGIWRFKDGIAVEHWEMAPAEGFDEFFLSGDPDFTDGSAEEFWSTC